MWHEARSVLEQSPVSVALKFFFRRTARLGSCSNFSMSSMQSMRAFISLQCNITSRNPSLQAGMRFWCYGAPSSALLNTLPAPNERPEMSLKSCATSASGVHQLTDRTELADRIELSQNRTNDCRGSQRAVNGNCLSASYNDSTVP